MAPRVCGFGAIRCWLVLLNVFYIMVALFLIGLVIAARTLAYDYTNIPILIGVAVVASFLFLVAVVGLFGAFKHHQVVLFFVNHSSSLLTTHNRRLRKNPYMIVLGLTGFVLFAVSAATLAAPKTWLTSVFRTVWAGMDVKQRTRIQDNLNCCGFENVTSNSDVSLSMSFSGGVNEEKKCEEYHPLCNTSTLIKKCCSDFDNTVYFRDNITEAECFTQAHMICPSCDYCYTAWEKTVRSGVLAVGSFGLIFSFTQIIGIVLAIRYRNLKDPDANPSAFL